MTTEPSGCRHCGIERRKHARQYVPEAAWHRWEQPTQQQILDRMKARRASKEAT